MNTKGFSGLEKALYFTYNIVKTFPDSPIILYTIVTWILLHSFTPFWSEKFRYSHSIKAFSNHNFMNTKDFRGMKELIYFVSNIKLS